MSVVVLFPACGRRRGVLLAYAVCDDLLVPSNSRIALRLSPGGWFYNALVFVLPVTLSTLVSLGQPRHVRVTVLGFIWFGGLDALIVLRLVRTATRLESEGIRVRRIFASRFLPWSEIVGVEIGGRGKVSFVQVKTSSGEVVRLPAPIAGGGFDEKRFDARAAEIAAAWRVARPDVAEAVGAGHGIVDARGGARRV